MKKILVINGHPDEQSYVKALADAYIKSAKQAGAEVHSIEIAELNFNPNLKYGYRKRCDLEPDLLDAQQKIKWADHIVMLFPVWWGGVPALMKGFIDRVFLPGFAFQKRENSVWWDKYLTGKTGRIISTLDTPGWYYWLIHGRPSTNAIKKLVMEFCGIKPLGTTIIAPIRFSKDSFRANWLAKIEKLGEKMQ